MAAIFYKYSFKVRAFLKQNTPHVAEQKGAIHPYAPACLTLWANTVYAPLLWGQTGRACSLKFADENRLQL
ncbi:hypothetical protein CSR02_05950 [Acetobacter pomorum]|uniref:Uncharacterized protein n=1 Tax=Acetobacter pomorum TaxID=65959 RepID=A0A2G4RC89_9PROT|nr:hypothetical protein CSR02_05950 [Acetobacter pomorum]